MTARITIGILVTILAAPATSPRFDRRMPKEKEAIHLLNRLTFGPSADSLELLRKLGTKKWIEQQLDPSGIGENPELEAKLKPLTSLSMSQEELAQSYPPRQLLKAFADKKIPLPKDPDRRAMVERLIERYEMRKNKASLDSDRKAPAQMAPQRILARELSEQKLYRAVYSERQLQEVLTDFWFNHFNVYLDKGADRFLVTSYERDAIRPHVLGAFKELLLATAQHPAMLFYLDNWQSVAADAPAGRLRADRRRGLNENYARELLELHSLGVDGGYTQKDVVEVARCFTGWTIMAPYRGAAFTFNPRVHDKGEKMVLGIRIPAGGGREDGLKVIEIIASHPSTARFISTKLAQRFVADNPPAALINTLADTFQKSNGDIKAVMQTLLKSREFWSEAAHKSKVKSPFEMIASALRATDADVTTAIGIANRVGELGQPLYRKQEPTGYSNNSNEWMNSAALLGRMNFAMDLIHNKFSGVRVDMSNLGDQPHDVARRLLFADASSQTQEAIEKGIAQQKETAVIAGLVLGSPEFQRR